MAAPAGRRSPTIGNRADDAGSDVEIYRTPLTDTIRADTPTGAPEQLLALLDALGLERKSEVTAGPVYVWHEVPGHLDEDAQKKVVTRAIPSLLLARYVVNIPEHLFDPAAYREAIADIRNHRHPAASRPEAPGAAPAASPTTGSHRSRRSL
ncbi:hypothetical protein RB200_23150 [Streptomyces sp. PmtG]